MVSNQEAEQKIFKRFRQLYELPEGTIEYTDRPDIIIKSDRTTGIEITDFYLNAGECVESEQQQKPIREKVLKDAQSIYQKNGGRKIELSLCFNPITNKSIASKKGLAQKIACFASGLTLQESGLIPPASFSCIPELAFVYFNAREYEKPQWRLVQMHSTPIINERRLSEIIHEKERKAEGYQQCDAYWLLIVIDFLNRAQDQEITYATLPKIQSNVFEKILIYKTAYEEVLEVASCE